MVRCCGREGGELEGAAINTMPHSQKRIKEGRNPFLSFFLFISAQISSFVSWLKSVSQSFRVDSLQLRGGWVACSNPATTSQPTSQLVRRLSRFDISIFICVGADTDTQEHRGTRSGVVVWQLRNRSSVKFEDYLFGWMPFPPPSFRRRLQWSCVSL